MKKVLAVLLVLCVVLGAGTAMADPKDFEGREHRDQRPLQQKIQPEMKKPPMSAKHGKRHLFTPDMPQEIRNKVAELEKLRIDLEEAMTSDPLNKQKALESHRKIQKLEQQIENWRFERKLERIEKMQKNRKDKAAKPIPPKPKSEKQEAPKPEVKK